MSSAGLPRAGLRTLRTAGKPCGEYAEKAVMHDTVLRFARTFPTRELAIAAALFAAAAASIHLTRVPGGIALFWPGSVIAATLLIRAPAIRWVAGGMLMTLAVSLANVWVAHRAPGIALLFGLVNAVEIGLMVAAYRLVWTFSFPGLNINQAAHMAAILGIAIPGLAAVFGGIVVNVGYGKPFLDYTLQWWSSHTIGACLVGPPIILCSRAGLARLAKRRYLLENVLNASLCLCITWLLLVYVRFPFVSIGLLLMMSAFRMGGFGASLLSLAVGLLLTNLWAFGLRPLGLDQQSQIGTLAGLPVIALLATVMPPIAVGIGTDLRRATARALRASERRFRESMEYSPVGMLLANLQGNWTYANVALQSMLGYTAEEFRALPPGGPGANEEWLEGAKRLRALVEGKLDYYDVVRRFRHKDGHWVWTHVAVSIMGREDPEPMLIAQIESMDARRQAEGRLAAERQRFKVTLETISDAVVTTDVQRQITFINSAAQSLLGITAEAALGRRVDEVMHLMESDAPKQAANLLTQSALHASVVRRETACLLHRPDGSMCFVTDTVSPVIDSAGAVTGFVLIFRDSSFEISHALELKHRAMHDALTGLSNRRDFEQRLAEIFQKSSALGRPAALMAIDLDRFKAVNDAGGHAAGDAMLQQVAEACRRAVRTSDVVARLGGDEFAIILNHCAQERSVHIAEQLLQTLNSVQLDWQGTRYTIGASIGIAHLHGSTTSDKQWLADADQACYQAKHDGRGVLRQSRAARQEQRSVG